MPAAPTRRLLAAPLTLAAVAALLSACGTSTAGTDASASSGARFTARLALAKCMRAHGVNVPDPSATGGPGEGIGRALRDYPPAQIRTAFTACRQYAAKAFPRFNLTPAQRAQRQQQLIRFARCMRSHGINIPDPVLTGSPGANAGFGFRRAFGSVDRNSPAFQSALKACGSLRPRFGRGGGLGSQAGPPAAAVTTPGA